MTKLKDVYPLYLANEAQQPNTDLEVTDKYTGEVAFRCALADAKAIDAGIAGTVEAAEPPVPNGIPKLAFDIGGFAAEPRGVRTDSAADDAHPPRLVERTSRRKKTLTQPSPASGRGLICFFTACGGGLR